LVEDGQPPIVWKLSAVEPNIVLSASTGSTSREGDTLRRRKAVAAETTTAFQVLEVGPGFAVQTEHPVGRRSSVAGGMC
jgi:hypothetical protein